MKEVVQSISRNFISIVKRLRMLSEYQSIGKIEELKFIKNSWENDLKKLDICKKYIGEKRFNELVNEG